MGRLTNRDIKGLTRVDGLLSSSHAGFAVQFCQPWSGRIIDDVVTIDDVGTILLQMTGRLPVAYDKLTD